MRYGVRAIILPQEPVDHFSYQVCNFILQSAMRFYLYFEQRTFCQLNQVSVNHNEMQQAAQQDEHVEDLVGAELGMAGIEFLAGQGVDHAADGVGNTAKEQKQESGVAYGVPQLRKCHGYGPAHHQIEHRREPLRAVDPEELDDHADDGDAPDNCQKDITGAAGQCGEADRRVTAGDQQEDGQMVELLQVLVHRR